MDGINISAIGNADLADLKSFTKIFFEEISRYPLAWLNYATPPVIAFGKGVNFPNGEALAGAENGVIVYNVQDWGDEGFRRQVVHHELMHWLERSSKTYDDPNWPGTEQDYQEQIDVKDPNLFKDHPKAGFVSNYARTNSQEDKAETYSRLFSVNDYSKLDGWEKNDPILKAKVDYLKKFIQARVAKMDEQYFTDRFKGGNFD